MVTATKFMFGTDFREGGRKAASEADLGAARADGFQSGREQGRREAEAQFNGLAGELARSAERLFALEGARMAAIEEQAAEVALAAARAFAGAALAEKPTAALAQAIRDCIGHARQAPHLAVRVNEAAVEAAEELAKRLALEHGFAGRLVVLGDPGIRPGDGRIEWADGGFVTDSERLSALIEQAVASVFPGGRAPRQ